MRNCPKSCLIVPCFNEERRLDIEAFKSNSKENIIFVFVNDGSKDKTGEILSSHKGPNWHVVELEKNSGKSEAIRQGALYILENELYNDISWFGFWDADLSVPLEELDNFFCYRRLFASDAECIIGSRVKRMGSDIVRSDVRHYLGRIFCTLVSFIFSITYYDTQCGAKLFQKHLLKIGFEKPFVANWIFDVELLLRLKECSVVEYPLQVWCEKSGSKIRFFSVLFEVGRDLIRLRMRK